MANEAAAGAATSGAFGIVTSLINAAAAKKQQERQMQHDQAMAQQNYYFGEAAADAADARQRAQFNDLYSIQAQMRQIKEAGLSPSLMFGGVPGQGGANAPQGSGAQGAANNLGRYQIVDPMMASQIGLMTAQAMKAKAEADRLKGEGKMGELDAAKILAETGQIQAETTYKQAQAALEKVKADIASATAGEQIQTIVNECQISGEKALQASTETEIKKLDLRKYNQTFEQQVQRYQLENKDLQTDIISKIFGIEKTSAEIELINKEIGKVLAETAKTWTEQKYIQKNYDLQKNFIKNQIGAMWKQLEQSKELTEKGIDKDKENNFRSAIFGLISTIISSASIVGSAVIRGGRLPMIAPILGANYGVPDYSQMYF